MKFFLDTLCKQEYSPRVMLSITTSELVERASGLFDAYVLANPQYGQLHNCDACLALVGKLAEDCVRIARIDAEVGEWLA